jgi:hypothetical protein
VAGSSDNEAGSIWGGRGFGRFAPVSRQRGTFATWALDRVGGTPPEWSPVATYPSHQRGREKGSTRQPGCRVVQDFAGRGIPLLGWGIPPPGPMPWRMPPCPGNRPRTQGHVTSRGNSLEAETMRWAPGRAVPDWRPVGIMAPRSPPLCPLSANRCGPRRPAIIPPEHPGSASSRPRRATRRPPRGKSPPLPIWRWQLPFQAAVEGMCPNSAGNGLHCKRRL